ncbi:hypothetical protein V8E51_007197 [Hyaloscypha variabilis]
MTEATYKSQIDAIGYKALERKLSLQEVAAYYFTWRAAAKQAYPDPKVPAIYHDFLAERETWTHFFPKDNFPGKDPLFDCLMSALCKEKVPDQYIKKEDDMAEWKISKLQETIQQKDLLIQSKDELLGDRAEALRASKELLAEKDKIIKIREGDIQEASRLINAREQAIAEKDETINNLEENLQQAQNTIAAHEETIEEKTQAVRNAKQPRKEVFIQIAKKDKHIENLKEQIERQKAHVARLEDNLRVKGIKNKALDKRWSDDISTLKAELAQKDHEIQALKYKLNKCGIGSPSQIPKTEGGSEVKDEGREDGEMLTPSIKVKTEPMDY